MDCSLNKFCHLSSSTLALVLFRPFHSAIPSNIQAVSSAALSIKKLPLIRNQRCITRRGTLLMHGSAWDNPNASANRRIHDTSPSPGVPECRPSHQLHHHHHHHTNEEHGSHNRTHRHASHRSEQSLPRTPITLLWDVLDFLADMRHSLRIAVTGAALLAIATILSATCPAASGLRFLALTACLAFTGLPALTEVASDLVASRGRSVDADTLMTLAAVAALATGAVAEAALLATLYALSHAVEGAVNARARADLDSLRDLAPQIAWRVPTDNIRTGTPTAVPVEEVQVGDYILVRQGEVAPCDGIVVDGEAFIILQHLTGEPSPKPVSKNDVVIAGARAVDGPLVICVLKVGAESTIARISRLVTSAEANRPRITRIFDHYSSLYTRTILGIAASIALLFPLLTGTGWRGTRGSMKRALGFLVAASPCALVIGAPVAYLSSLSACARRGVLVKSGPRALDSTAESTHVIFDKTGTLTTGDLVFEKAYLLPDESSWSDDVPPVLELDKSLEGDELRLVVAVAAALERGAVHPIATALASKATELDLNTSGLHFRGLQNIPGQGVEATLVIDDMSPLRRSLGKVNSVTPQHSLVSIGRMSFVIRHRPWLKTLRDNVSSGGSLLVSALRYFDRIYLLLFRDLIRAEGPDCVAAIKSMGYRVSLLTGDGAKPAELLGQSVGGLDDVVANATPESKLEHIRTLQSTETASPWSWNTRGGVVMIGDGVNDAPALAAANVGIACGLTSATAVHSADVVLVRPDLMQLAWYLQKAAHTRMIVKQNIMLALLLMVIAVPFILLGAVPLWLAVLLHEGGTVLVGLNGLRLLSDKLS